LETGLKREFFLFTDGWDKDADFHVAQGSRVGPLPYHGMDDQAYGSAHFREASQAGWTKEFNTRWVSPETLPRQPARN
jgi:hypothetical protein